MFQRRVHRLQIANAWEGRAIDASVAFLGAIQTADLQGIHAELFSQFVNDRFRCKGGIRGTRSAIRRGFGFIDDDVVAIDLHVRDGIGRENTHRTGAHWRARKRAGLIHQRGFGGDDLPILPGTHLYLDVRRWRGSSRLEFLDPAHDDFDRLASFTRQHGGKRFEVD